MFHAVSPIAVGWKAKSEAFIQSHARRLQVQTGSNWIRNLVPVARATFSRVRVDGGTRPLSRRATAECVVFILAASSVWFMPACVRASTSARQLEFRSQPLVGLSIVRIPAPPVMQFVKRAHCNVSLSIMARAPDQDANRQRRARRGDRGQDHEHALGGEAEAGEGEERGDAEKSGEE